MQQGWPLRVANGAGWQTRLGRWAWSTTRDQEAGGRGRLRWVADVTDPPGYNFGRIALARFSSSDKEGALPAGTTAIRM